MRESTIDEPFLREIDVENQRADAIALAIALVRNLLLLGQDRLGAAEVDDHVLALEALDDSRDDFLLAILELVENLLSLGVADMLDEILLGRLRRDPAHRRGVELDQNFVADLGVGIVFRARLGHVGLGRRIGDLLDHGLDLEQLDFAELGIEARLDIAVGPEGAPRRRMHHLLDRVDHDRFVDAFFLGYLLDYPVQIDLHTASPERAKNLRANFICCSTGRKPIASTCQTHARNSLRVISSKPIVCRLRLVSSSSSIPVSLDRTSLPTNDFCPSRA